MTIDRDLALDTIVVHAGGESNPMESLVPPIVQSATFELRDSAHGAELSSASAPERLYTRWGNPTTRRAEQALARLEGGEAALVCSSGMGAISALVVSRLKAGDHVVAGRSLYAGTTELVTELLPRYGVEHTLVDPADLDALEEAIRPTTRMIYVETITNPTMRVPDLAGIAARAEGRDLLTVVDGTFATPVNCRPIEHGFDVVLHSATKFLNGHSDVTAGVVVSTREVIEKAWYHLKILGASISPFESWLLLRGLRTLALRMERQNENALAVARHLEGHPAVERVHYPGLASHPDHEVARRMLSPGSGGVVSFELKGGAEAGRRLVESVRVIRLAVSLGGVESLVCHPATTTHAPVSRERREAAGISDGLVRLAVGIEAAKDLIADLDQAMAS